MPMIFKHPILIFLMCITVSSCVTIPPPTHIENICKVFRQYPNWYWTAQKTESRWHLPISVQMAIIYQESHFRSDAKPPRERLLRIIPWMRPTSAYGYSQAVNSTWQLYKRESDNPMASRNAFRDASDFIGWYSYHAHRRCKIPLTDAFHLYLAYHEGMGGYEHHSYRKKKWLIAVSKRVHYRAHTYAYQLKQCAANLPKKPWWQFW